MFFEEGWIPLSEVTSEVFRRLQAIKVDGGIPQGSHGLSALLAISVWEICDACTKVGATAPDGTVIPASKDLVAWADPRSLLNEHINLRIGSVGSSDLPDEDGNLPDAAELARRYGPFLSLPVVIPINNFQSSLTFLDEEVRGQKPKDEAVIRAARSIVAMMDNGDLVTRDLARQALGSSLSRRKFKLAWAMVAQHRPEMAAPNRWQGL